MPTLKNYAQSLEFGNLVELFIVDTSAIGGSVMYFHNGTEQGANEYHFQGVTYTARPCTMSGFEYSAGSDSPIARPHIKISNIGSEISALCRDLGDLVGAKITRKRTYHVFLDDQPGHDSTQEFAPDVYYVDRKVEEREETVEFELISPFDFENIFLPRRQLLASVCTWIYRGPDCAYIGKPVTDEFGNDLTTATNKGAYNAGVSCNVGDYFYITVNGIKQYYVCIEGPSFESAYADTDRFTRDICPKILNGGCRKRFGPGSPNPTLPLRTSAFPAMAHVPQTGSGG